MKRDLFRKCWKKYGFHFIDNDCSRYCDEHKAIYLPEVIIVKGSGTDKVWRVDKYVGARYYGSPFLMNMRCEMCPYFIPTKEQANICYTSIFWRLK